MSLPLRHQVAAAQPESWPRLSQSSPPNAGQNSSPSDSSTSVLTLENAAEIRNRIMRTLFYFHANRSGIDVESLAHDIFVEAWEGSRLISTTFIKHRLINAIRHRTRHSQHLHLLADTLHPQFVEAPSDRFQRLIQLARLTHHELEVVFSTQLREYTILTTAENMNRPPEWVSDTLAVAFDKMRKAGRLLLAKEQEEEL